MYHRWTEIMDAIMNRAGTASEIAEAIFKETGVLMTRNAVIGRRHRRGYKSIKPKRYRKRRNTTSMMITGTSNTLFTARTQGECSWPLWAEDTPVMLRCCCGQPVVSPHYEWCAAHKRLGVRK